MAEVYLGWTKRSVECSLAGTSERPSPNRAIRQANLSHRSGRTEGGDRGCE